MNRFVSIAVSILTAVLAVPSSSLAHAFLDHAEPRVGSTVSQSPAGITLVFTEDVEPSFSRIELFDQGGMQIETRALEHPAADTLSVALPPLKPGAYKVRWAVISVDTHPTDGSFEFSFKP